MHLAKDFSLDLTTSVSQSGMSTQASCSTSSKLTQLKYWMLTGNMVDIMDAMCLPHALLTELLRSVLCQISNLFLILR
jgi:hypothetical protein